MPIQQERSDFIHEIWRNSKGDNREERRDVLMGMAVGVFQAELGIDHDTPGYLKEAAHVGALVERHAHHVSPTRFIGTFAPYIDKCRASRRECPHG